MTHDQRPLAAWIKSHDRPGRGQSPGLFALTLTDRVFREIAQAANEAKQTQDGIAEFRMIHLGREAADRLSVSAD